MSEFQIWFGTGVAHILNLDALDHILFVALVVVAFPLREWRRLLILITGFTLGHGLALLLSMKEVLRLPSSLTEFLIAITILITALYHIFQYKRTEVKHLAALYILIPLFGGIHGLGFSSAILSILGPSREAAAALFYFNIGVEAGQLIVVTAVSLFSLLLTAFAKCPFHYFKLILSCLIAFFALFILAARWPF